jgi:hypothetical protein
LKREVYTGERGEKESAFIWKSSLSPHLCKCFNSSPVAHWIPNKLTKGPCSLLGFCNTGLYAGDGDALPTASQDARLTL